MIRWLALTLTILTAVPAVAEEIDYKKLYAQVAPGVVIVIAKEGDMYARGTGSIIRRDGLVVTNAHVILSDQTKKPAPELFVFLKPDKISGKPSDDLKRGFTAQWLAYSSDMDLAILRIVNAPDNLAVVEISDDSHIDVGEATAAIGHPEQGAKWSLTTGRISGEWSDFEGIKGKDVYQMETSINHGNSGGPLVDGNGYMVGINTAGARLSSDGTAITGVNFAIKSHVVREWIAAADEKIAEAPEMKAQAIPPPQVVARAPSAPPAQETMSAKTTSSRPPTTSFVPPAPPSSKRVKLSQALPRAAAPKPRGFTSGTPPGKIFSGFELTRQRAQSAFDELDREVAKENARDRQ